MLFDLKLTITIACDLSVEYNNCRCSRTADKWWKEKEWVGRAVWHFLDPKWCHMPSFDTDNAHLRPRRTVVLLKFRNNAVTFVPLSLGRFACLCVSLTDLGFLRRGFVEKESIHDT